MIDRYYTSSLYVTHQVSVAYMSLMYCMVQKQTKSIPGSPPFIHASGLTKHKLEPNVPQHVRNYNAEAADKLVLNKKNNNICFFDT